MPITERLEDPGSFTIQLNTSAVPFDEIRLMKELGQIVITPAWFLHPELFTDADLVAAARYTGVILGIEWEGDTITLRGQGPWWYLGDADGNGPVLGADVTYAAATVDDILKPISAGGILPDAIGVGTITTTGVGTYTGTFYAPQTCLSAVRTVLATLGMHARINPGWTMDACLATRDDVFVVSSPTVVVVKKGFGADPTFTGIEPTSLRDRVDAIRWVSKSIIENIDEAGARFILSSLDRAVVPYQDGRGNQLVRAVIQSGPSSDDVGFDTFHARALDQWDTQREEELSTDQFDFVGAFEAGDRVYVYAPELGFYDDANQIFYRGTVLSPVALQVPVDSWPVKVPEMGVYYRPARTNYGQAVIGDGPLAYWRLDETSGTDVADSAGHSSGPFNATYENSPPLDQTGVMKDGSGSPSVDFDGTNHMVLGADWAALDFAGTAAFSLESWLNTDNVNGVVIIIQKQTGGAGDGWELIRNGSAVNVARVGATSHGVTAGTIVAGTDHHVVGTYDGTTLRLYLDAVEVGADATVVSMNANAVALSIGRDSVLGTNRFNGRLDEVAVYGRALTGTEIAEHYAIGTQDVAAGRWLDLTRYVRSE